jgi:hypothetical protein
MLFSVKVAAVPRRELTESDREFAKSSILGVMDELKSTISTRKPILFGPEEVDPSAKRARVAEAPRMAVDETLTITDTDTRFAIQSLKYLLKIVKGEWFVEEEESHLLIGILLAVMSTPWAAFYLDFDPTKLVYRNVRNGVYAALRTEFKEALCEKESVLPLAKKLAAEVCNNYGPCKTPLQVLFRRRMFELLDLSMEKITSTLHATRSAWKEYPVRLAETCVYTVAIPEGELPQITISAKWLPVHILPAAGIRNPRLHTTPYGPKSFERDMASDFEPAHEKFNAAILNTLKYELTMWVVEKESPLCVDIKTHQVETVVDVVRGCRCTAACD